MQKTVLIAAGDPVTALGLDRLLSEAGFQALEAQDASGVLSATGEDRPDLLLIDCGLPGRDGFCLLDDLRRSGRDLPPVVMLIGRSRSVEREKARALGAAAVVTKPFAGGALLEVVLRLLGAPVPVAPPAERAWGGVVHG